MRKIGIYGGTFNPPHWGHIRGASYAKAALGLDEVLMLPDGQAPHKTLPEHSPTPQQRLEMLALGLQEDGLTACGLCLEREGESYASPIPGWKRSKKKNLRGRLKGLKKCPNMSKKSEICCRFFEHTML